MLNHHDLMYMGHNEVNYMYYLSLSDISSRGGRGHNAFGDDAKLIITYQDAQIFVMVVFRRVGY